MLQQSANRPRWGTWGSGSCQTKAKELYSEMFREPPSSTNLNALTISKTPDTTFVMISLTGKVIVVTGVTSGIGLATSTSAIRSWCKPLLDRHSRRRSQQSRCCHQRNLDALQLAFLLPRFLNHHNSHRPSPKLSSRFLDRKTGLPLREARRRG